MSKENQGLELAEEFIKKSKVLSKYYSALPYKSYHMTLFNIWSMASKPIPPVQDWLDKGNELPNGSLLPKSVLKNELLAAKQACRTHVNNDFTVTWKCRGKYKLSLSAIVDENTFSKIKAYRAECAKIFKHEDKNLMKIGYHITLGYLYKEPEKDALTLIDNELEKLGNLILKVTGKNIKLQHGDVYWYKSMTHFWEYTGRE